MLERRRDEPRRVRRARPRDVASVIPRLLTGRATAVTRHPEAEDFSGFTRAAITAAGEPLPVEADGEFLGHHHRIEYGVAPAALRIVA